MTLDFLSPDLARAGTGTAPVARSPLDDVLRRAGARFELRDGWRVPTGFGDAEGEAEAERTTVAVADRSALGKLEVHGIHELEPGTAARSDGAWWCPVTLDRALVLCPPGATRALRERLGGDAVELTGSLAAIGVAGPRARDVLARLTALDLRPDRTPTGGFRPGSVARVPAMVLREEGDRYLLLFGSAHAEYLWTVVWDAAEPLGGRRHA